MSKFINAFKNSVKEHSLLSVTFLLLGLVYILSCYSAYTKAELELYMIVEAGIPWVLLIGSLSIETYIELQESINKLKN